MGKIRAIAMPLPPLAEQARIVARAQDMLAGLDRLQQRTAAEESANQALAVALLR